MPLVISSSSRISQSHYCALVREAWDANSVFCLSYGMRNQENWLLSCFCHRLVRKLWENLAKNPLFCVALIRPTNALCRTGQLLQPQVQTLHLTALKILSVWGTDVD